MNLDGVILRVRELIEKKTSFAICLPAQPTLDGVASATALYLALAKNGKEVALACDSDLASQYDLIAIDKVQTNITSQGDNLVVSFPYTEGAIDKVTYNIEGNKFNLLIQPKPGFDRLDSSNVSYNYTGGKVDVIIVIDSPTLDALGDIYFSNEESFKGVDIVNIDRHLTNANYGTVNIVEKQSSSLSQITFQLLQSLGIALDSDIATNLFAGISGATNNFTSYSVNADTFEVSAQLLKAGAVKKSQFKSRPQTMGGQPQPLTTNPFAGSAPAMSQNTMTQPLTPTSPVPQPVQPQPQPQSQPQVPMQSQQIVSDSREKPQAAPTSVEAKETTVEGQAPKDWLKPKIFKGSGGMV